MRTTLLLLASLAGSLVCAAPASAAPAAPASYLRSCNTCILSETKYLHCYCQSAAGRTVETEIDLDWCIANRFGRLTASPNGAFSASCSRERIFDSTRLTAYCNDGGGGARDTEINLNDFIHNNNGLLTCHGIMGVEGQVPGGARCPYPHTIC